MCHQNSLSKQAIGAESSPIGPNTLVIAANKNDRFRLRDDEAIQASTLNNHIHPIFRESNFLGYSPHMKQALRLASMFLRYESTLEFFVAPLFGRALDADGRNYLSDPLINKSQPARRKLIKGVREALDCLSHSITFQFVPERTKTFWARTLMEYVQPPHSDTCTEAFQAPCSTLVELRNQYLNFYRDTCGYSASSLGDRFRHDFHFAQCLVHEVTHALGVHRRGDMKEPHIRLDHLSLPEWGYAWENFMFGGIINPQDRSAFGTHILLRKVWADNKTAKRTGGKEYTAVPVSYIAQWFQKTTWKTIKVDGPMGIPPPIAHLKIQCSSTEGRWIVHSDCKDTEHDIQELRSQYAEKLKGDEANRKPIPPEAAFITTVRWQYTTTEQLQVSNIPVPTRVPRRSMMTVTAGPQYPHSLSHPVARSGKRKRQADASTDTSRPRKVTKRM